MKRKQNNTVLVFSTEKKVDRMKLNKSIASKNKAIDNNQIIKK
jgi:hypothetical protein